ncbi:MAG: hypothetical protein OSJ60_19185 [Lachnospiraceae bacterium]|jgi:hypothetical protein|nr:hypothetical protein C819_04226 [Lachnospiraceae bacterium 10-1]MCX4353719.1 hypothetical protein [Lachnospiraceae bacterium]
MEEKYWDKINQQQMMVMKMQIGFPVLILKILQATKLIFGNILRCVHGKSRKLGMLGRRHNEYE